MCTRRRRLVRCAPQRIEVRGAPCYASSPLAPVAAELLAEVEAMQGVKRAAARVIASLIDKGDEARATIDRVRAEADRWDRASDIWIPYPTDDAPFGIWADPAERIRAALDGDDQ